MSYRFVFDPSRCSACGACAVACMDQNDRDTPFRRCETRETGRGGDVKMQYLSIGCLHCENAPCIEACPMGCITRDAETGFVLCDNAACVGCRRCEAVCPVAAPVFDPDGKMRKCDGCITRVKAALPPACVRACPFGALGLEER